MASVAPIARPTDPLIELQQAFFMFSIGGDVRIGRHKELAALKNGARHEDVGMYGMQAGKLLMERHLENLPISCDPKRVIKDFVTHPNTVMYDEIAFSPLQTPPTTLNYWSPSPIQPMPGDWLIIRNFLLEQICGGDIGLYRYLICYLAHMLQRPEEKPGVIPSLMGGQGTGKGTFGQLLRAIWPHTTLQVSDVSHVVGQFNASIERHYAVFMDEALFAGDKKAIDRLKSFVTEPFVTIEQKLQPRRSIRSFHRFFAASNHRHFAQVDTDDRRFVFFQVGSGRKADAHYWNSVHAALDDPEVISAAVHDLQRIKLDQFNVRLRPKTRAHVDQKLRSLSGFDRYWYEVLQTGQIAPGQPFSEHWSDARFVATASIMHGWTTAERGQRKYGSLQERDIHEALKRLCPSARSGRRLINGGHQRGKEMPSLSAAREEFAKYLDATIPWD
ncbi:primase-helicase family protein [Altererythrobacter ishigakiensis]|uniref:Virulence-associated protein E n=1 Tax=Altererythrobacter ishigakiensis TaxID=476157 RepID=A0A562UT26_9SPHN|nr:primase-helicase family protein [Altererythrobacter ishigakiensis]TWJ08765.1 virulence-associated protein E [Altererythrobacter ishigakiensis]